MQFADLLQIYKYFSDAKHLSLPHATQDNSIRVRNRLGALGILLTCFQQILKEFMKKKGLTELVSLLKESSAAANSDDEDFIRARKKVLIWCCWCCKLSRLS